MSMVTESQEVSPDLSLVAATLSGDREAFAGLVSRYEVKLRGYCRHMLGDYELAEDAAQEVFLKAYTSLESFKGQARFLSWLLGIAYNHCIDLLRKRRLRSWLVFGWGANNQGSSETRSGVIATVSPNISLAEATNPLDHAASQELLKAVLASLSPEYRSIMILYEGYGFGYEEIAESLGCSVESIRAKIKRARNTARKIRSESEANLIRELHYGSGTV